MSGDKVYTLRDEQKAAVAPDDSVWLSASAGTGKTQVLSSRVLRLLLQDDVSPSQILCLTFTKAGATEMAARINSTLASWVRLDEIALHKALEAIGAPTGMSSCARARTLFAAVLDCPGGGLRIDTIHAFAQWLLGAFPFEAGLVPGTRAMEDRERVLLFRQEMGALLVEAERVGDSEVLDALGAMALRMTPDQIEKFLLRCADARDAWFGLGAWVPPLRPRVNRLIGLEADADGSNLAVMCEDQAFDCAALRNTLAVHRLWNTATAQKAQAVIGDWLAGDGDARLAGLDELAKALLTEKGLVKDLKSLAKFDPDIEACILRAADCIRAIRERRTLIELAERLTPALTLGRRFAIAWDAAKQREGYIDFDDQIRKAADLLNNSDLAEWIRYKLDRRFDHVLVDEAQDTNAAQWQIINALIADFYAGQGARGDVMRTLFVVGDYKQAIFRFQGTDPENFRIARERVDLMMRGAAENALRSPGAPEARALQKFGLGQSFRSGQTVLDFVDSAIGHIGHEAFGLDEAPQRHTSDLSAGYVALWRPVGVRAGEEETEEESDEDAGSEGWLSRPDRQLAERIAQQIKAWMDDGFPLMKGGARRAGPGDVMVLVRKRRELAGLIVARLHAAGVPVAGVDRLRLGAPLAVRDLVAALRFAAQPLDDLNLAALLASPLIGWSQEQLLEHGYREPGVRLWTHLRQTRHPEVAATMEQLGMLLTIADFDPPQALLHWLLVGPWQGRRKLIARLGREANDAIDELLNAAHAYVASGTPSLLGFLAWFDAGDGELKREAEASNALVRVMTVHGAKGLQAPIVILADAAGNPKSRNPGALDLTESVPDGAEAMFSARTVPLPSLRKEENLGRILEAQAIAEAGEAEEHWRLLYVAMTRAEEALFLTGSLSKNEKAPAPDSWYGKLAELFTGQAELADPIWDARLDFGAMPAISNNTAAIANDTAERAPLPLWLTAAPRAEPRPARPLAPSSLGEDHAADPPLATAAGMAAARRGVLIHRLLERLPEVPSPDRAQAASRWLVRQAADTADGERAEIAAAALAVIADPRWADLFGPSALAEVPIAALVGTQVVAGTIDRLLVEPDRIRLVDFKTARRPPASLDQVPEAILRQMAAYVAALEVTFPGRRIEAALLYTQTPQLIELPDSRLINYKHGLLGFD